MQFESIRTFYITSYSPEVFVNIMSFWHGSNFFCLNILGHFSQNIYFKTIQHINHSWRHAIIQNVLMSHILLISLDPNLSIHFVNNIYWEYYDILAKEVIYEDLLWHKIFVIFDNFCIKYPKTFKPNHIPVVKML